MCFADAIEFVSLFLVGDSEWIMRKMESLCFSHCKVGVDEDTRRAQLALSTETLKVLLWHRQVTTLTHG